MLALLSNPITRTVVVGVASAVAAFSAGYFKGNGDARVKCAEKQAQAAEQWASDVAEDLEKAYQRGVESARIAHENESRVEEIANEAAKEEGADDMCLSANTVERLRQLQ